MTQLTISESIIANVVRRRVCEDEEQNNYGSMIVLHFQGIGGEYLLLSNGPANEGTKHRDSAARLLRTYT